MVKNVMAEYIERETALALVKPDVPEDLKAAVTIATAKKLVRSIVRRAPADDVAPVVRCRDCKYYRVSAMLAPNKFCFRLKHPVEDRPIGYNFAPDDFCSHGERKDGGSDGK